MGLWLDYGGIMGWGRLWEDYGGGGTVCEVVNPLPTPTVHSPYRSRWQQPAVSRWGGHGRLLAEALRGIPLCLRHEGSMWLTEPAQPTGIHLQAGLAQLLPPPGAPGIACKSCTRSYLHGASPV